MCFDISLLTCFHRIVENEDNTINKTKETANLVSFGDTAESKQMPGSYLYIYIYSFICVHIGT